MQNVITLTRTAECWLATWSGPHAKRVYQNFGTTTLPTAFTGRAAAETVRKAIATLNPESVVAVKAA